MRVEVESKSGPISGARRSLARAIAIETFSPFRQHVSSIRFDVPATSERTLIKKCDIRIKLADGVLLECQGSATNVADAIERAAHDMRRLMATQLGLPLPARVPVIDARVDSRSERRAS